MTLSTFKSTHYAYVAFPKICGNKKHYIIKTNKKEPALLTGMSSSYDHSLLSLFHLHAYASAFVSYSSSPKIHKVLMTVTTYV